MIDMTIILAEKRNDQYIPIELVRNIEDFLADLEYGDVAENKYQLWEYPSGQVQAIEVDRKVDQSQYYSVPNTSKGQVWVPKLVPLVVDKVKVTEAFAQFHNGDNS